MHLLYRSTSFSIPAEKVFRCSCVRDFDGRPEQTSCSCSTRFKPFHPLINLSLTHGALFILSQHTTVNFHRFHSFCPKKAHYATLFFDGAILQKMVHVFALVAATRLKAERCTALVELFNRHCLYCAMHQLLSVPVTAQFKNCLYLLIHPRT